MPLYEKYEDKETSPVFELEEHFKERFDSGDYYKILYNKELLIGGINVKAIEPGKMKLRIINILKEYENKKNRTRSCKENRVYVSRSYRVECYNNT